jgi:flagellar hook-basal body complex protein FliE
MITSASLGATNAYAQMANLAKGAGAGQDAAATQSGSGGFGGLVQDMVASVVETGKAAEASQAALVSGQGDVIDVVTAVAEAELALETMVSVRDKVIAAYEEIMRMPI